MDQGTNKAAPHNLEAEASLLGAVLIDSDALTKIADAVTPEDFYDAKNRHIYEAVLALYDRRSPIDVLTLSNQLKGAGLLEIIGGPAYLTELTNFVPTASHVEQYADIVAQKALRRRLIKASQDMANLGHDESKQLKELIEEAEARLFEVSQKNVKPSVVSLETILAESFDRLDELHKDKGKLRGIPTGYKDLDNILAGLQKSDLFVLAARPSMGKTALVLNLAHNVAVQAKAPVLFFSLEMSKEQLVDRLLAMESGVDAWALRTGNLTDSDFEKLGHAMGTLSEAKIYIDDLAGITVGDMRTKARREAHQHGIGLIIIDYLQLMSGGSRFGSSDNRVQEISEISRGLKSLARELNVPVIALSQLSRSVESRSPQIPQLSDLRDSGCLAGDTLVYLPSTGENISIKDLVQNTTVSILCIDSATYKTTTETISNAFCTGKKPVLALRTALGRTIRATANHKFLTISGWKRLDELQPGDHIATPRSLTEPNQLTATMTTQQAALLGHLIGGGCTLPRHAIQYTTNDISLAETVSELATEVFGPDISPRVKSERNWYQVYLSATKHLTHKTRNPVSVWLENMGIFGLSSYEKFIPNIVFQQTNKTIAIFLKHLWATDGCVKRNGGRNGYPAVYYASSSYKLAVGVQTLLLRLDIHAHLSSHPQINKERDQYHVSVSGNQNLSKFTQLIGAIGRSKIEHLQLISEYLSSHSENTNKDVIPHYAWRQYVVPAMRAAKMSTRQFQALLGNKYCGTSLYKNNLSRNKALRATKIINSKELEYLATSDIYWDKISTITPDGEDLVYDLTVPGNHNFVANNIFAHNSIEQDADVVAFIYREDYYNPETERKNITDILIKKHRNGPVGNVELYFERDKQRFRSLDTKHQDPFSVG